jgi:hypothetical protein
LDLPKSDAGYDVTVSPHPIDHVEISEQHPTAADSQAFSKFENSIDCNPKFADLIAS